MMINYIEAAQNAGKQYAKDENKLLNNALCKAEFDKTYVGYVVDKRLYANSNEIRDWIVSVHGRSYYVGVNQSDITNIGQKVRLIIPSGKYENKWAEVIGKRTRPDKIEFTENDDLEEETEVIDGETVPVTWATSSVKETWELSDMTNLERDYTITIKNRDTDKEEAKAITCPNGHVIWLEGFYLNDFGGSSNK